MAQNNKQINPPRKKDTYLYPKFQITIAEAIILTILIFVLLLFFSGHLPQFLGLIYSPVSFLILVIIIGEYIILKGIDRSRIYRIQLRALRSKRNDDIQFLRAVEQKILEIEKALDEAEKMVMNERLHYARTILKAIIDKFRTRT